MTIWNYFPRDHILNGTDVIATYNKLAQIQARHRVPQNFLFYLQLNVFQIFS